MPRRAFFFVLLLLLPFGVLGQEMTVDDALALFPEGEDVAVLMDEAGQTALEAAIVALELALGVTTLFDHTNEDAYAALEIDRENTILVNALSQGYYTWGDIFLKEKDEKKDAFTRGQYWGLKSLRMSEAFAAEELRHGFIDAVHQATDIAALFWTYGNWSRKDEYEPVQAVFRNDPPKLVALIERCLELDDAFMDYAAYRALAAFWGGLPPAPLIEFGQKLPRALSYICPVIDEPGYCTDCSNCPLAEDVDAYFENRLIFAEYYLMEKSLWADAERVLQSILDDPIGERFALYNAYCQLRAAELIGAVREEL